MAPDGDEWTPMPPAPSAVWADGAVLVWGGNASYEGLDLRADGLALVP